jgi:hypothetical protein
VHNVINCFVRDGPGRWRCVEPCDFIVQFMGYDLAALLDEEYESQTKRHA